MEVGLSSVLPGAVDFEGCFCGEVSYSVEHVRCEGVSVVARTGEVGFQGCGVTSEHVHGECRGIRWCVCRAIRFWINFWCWAVRP